MQPIAILYEHPEWFKPLFAELDHLGVPYLPLQATEHNYDPDEREVPYSLVVNRMSPSAWTRGHRHAIFHTLRYLEHLDAIRANYREIAAFLGAAAETDRAPGVIGVVKADAYGHGAVQVAVTTGAPVRGPVMTRGQTYAHTFSAPGVYDYMCGLHPSMKGQVEVK